MESTCPDCGWAGPTKSFVHDPSPPEDNSGCWCPQCEFSVEIGESGQVEPFVDITSHSQGPTIDAII